jgi:hypothetical protein
VAGGWSGRKGGRGKGHLRETQAPVWGRNRETCLFAAIEGMLAAIRRVSGPWARRAPAAPSSLHPLPPAARVQVQRMIMPFVAARGPPLSCLSFPCLRGPAPPPSSFFLPHLFPLTRVQRMMMPFVGALGPPLSSFSFPCLRGLTPSPHLSPSPISSLQLRCSA